MKPRVLHLITVYNGRAFVPRAIESAMRMDQSDATIDVLVLDDASPEPGWSAELRDICKGLGAHYYLTPRNLGIPRNCSLGLLTAIEKKYDYVTINNSDVIFPRNLISVLVKACKQDNVGSVTAWSNNVSIYSLPNQDPDKYLSNQDVVDYVSSTFESKYGSEVIDVPAGISFCIMMPVEVVKKVGVMDPVFGRGYCEETDWSLRSLALGYRICLAPGTFVYHQGRGSNLAAGLVSGAHSTVPENEVIIDFRYPNFRNQCQAFENLGKMPRYKGEAIDYLIESAAKSFGYRIVPGWNPPKEDLSECQLLVELSPDLGTPSIRYVFAGFEQTWPYSDATSIANVIKRFGPDNLRDNAFATLADSGGRNGRTPYPSAVFSADIVLRRHGGKS